MHAIVSAAVSDDSAISPSFPISLRTNTVQDEEQERASTQSRFAMAQQLFKRQQTVPLKTPSPPFIPQQITASTSPTRVRSFTASSSLYSKIGHPIQAETTGPAERARAISSPGVMAFGQSFAQSKTQPSIQQPAADIPVPKGKTAKDSQCILSDFKYMAQPFDITAINGRTETGKPTWWCSHDKLVIFDGVTPDDDTDIGQHWTRLLVRTTKGLEISRKNCEKEVIHVDIPCEHCKDLLGKEKWCYEARAKRTRVCKECQERCWREMEREMEVETEAEEKEEMEKEDDRRDPYLDGGGEGGEQSTVREGSEGAELCGRQEEDKGEGFG